MPNNRYQPFDYVKPPELDGGETSTLPVAIIGAGPIGLAAAIDLAQRGIKVTVLDDNNVVSVGSRAICWAKHTLEIFDRLGIGERMLDKGVTWKIGRLFHGEDEVYNFNLLPEDGHKYPAFINLQQYYVEQYLVERCADFPDLIDLRWKNKVVDHQDDGDLVHLTIETPDGAYALAVEYMLACDGAGSATRQRMGLSFKGETFEEQFLIADVEMEQSPFNTDEPERWFWFKPPFHNGQSALLHKQPDNIYRIDLQLGPDADTEHEKTEAAVMPRLKAIFGDKPFKLDWMSVYKFQCAKLKRMVHNRVLFVGDSAHVVSPFGARGGNGGMHDVDNLGWKLAAVLGGANKDLLETYNSERLHGASENIKNSSRATRFMTPKSPMEMMFRDEVLKLANKEDFARKLINSGRLSVPCALPIEPDVQTTTQRKIGTVIVDAPLSKDGAPCQLIDCMNGAHQLLVIKDDHADLYDVHNGQLSTALKLNDSSGLLVERYSADCAYLIRPDRYIAGITNDVSNEGLNKLTSLAHPAGTADEKAA
ncbi:MAG: FAD-dependent oxidoreductase [Hyphomicrobiales bacterium]